MPLNGTCVAVMPAILLNISATNWVELPMPPEENSNWPGLAFPIAIKSLTVFTPSDDDTTSNEGTLTVVVMPEKSRCVS